MGGADLGLKLGGLAQYNPEKDGKGITDEVDKEVDPDHKRRWYGHGHIPIITGLEVKKGFCAPNNTGWNLAVTWTNAIVEKTWTNAIVEKTWTNAIVEKT